MPSVREWWRRVREVEATLPETVYLTSIEDPDRGQRGGRVTEVDRSMAAQLLHMGWSRLSTDEEIREYREREAEIIRDIEAAEDRRRGVTVVTVGAAPGGGRGKR